MNDMLKYWRDTGYCRNTTIKNLITQTAFNIYVSDVVKYHIEDLWADSDMRETFKSLLDNVNTTCFKLNAVENAAFSPDWRKAILSIASVDKYLRDEIYNVIITCDIWRHKND